MGLLKTLAALALLCGFAYCGATVPLGERTFFGHVAQIWASEETQDLVNGVKEASDPMLDRIERGVEAGMEAATADIDGGSGAPLADQESAARNANANANDPGHPPTPPES